MDFYDIILNYREFDFKQALCSVTARDVSVAIDSDASADKRLLALLSPAAGELLEDMAQESQAQTLRYFGRSIQLYTPMYLSNYCENQCVYCGYQTRNPMARKKLSLEEVDKEAAHIAGLGFRHILILTGESHTMSPVAYIKDCVKILQKYFSSISVEIYPLQLPEYRELVAAGIDGLTLYQETYDRILYDALHVRGPKKDYKNRLDAPDRGAWAGVHFINIGALLGLSDWRVEAFFMGMHAKYLQDKFPGSEIGISVPRIQPHEGCYKPESIVRDSELVQIVTAMRLFMPRASIALSTRENRELRDNLMPLGITRMSASSSTAVGGHTINQNGFKQFEISDKRDLEQVKLAIRSAGYQPVLKDWV